MGQLKRLVLKVCHRPHIPEPNHHHHRKTFEYTSKEQSVHEGQKCHKTTSNLQEEWMKVLKIDKQQQQEKLRMKKLVTLY